MEQEHIERCFNCENKTFKPYIETGAHMHDQEEQFTFVRCTSCGLVFLNPRVKQEELGNYYRDYYLPYRGPSAWGRFAHLVQRDLDQTDQKRIRLVLGTKRINSDSAVLDIGCGKPTFLAGLYQKTGCISYGTDFVDTGWKKEPHLWKGLKLIKADIHDVEPAQKFDVITMWHYLEHDYQPGKTLSHIRKLSHDQTVLIIEVPHLDSWTRKWQGKYWEGFHTPRHTALYNPDTLSALLERNGWKVFNTKTYGTLNPYALFWLGIQEKNHIDWSMNMEKKLLSFVTGMFLTFPVFALQKFFPLGVMTLHARPGS